MFFIKKWILGIIGKDISKTVGMSDDTEVTVDIKQWWKSKTIWAIILNAGVGIIKIVKPELMGTPIAATLIALFTAIGIYGRVTATTTLQ